MKKKYICFLILIFLFIISKEVVANDTYYTVKAGDSLWDISRQNKVPIDLIKSLNNLQSDRLNIGQTLLLSEKADTNIYNNNSNIPGDYIVQKGDTLWSISKKYKIDINIIMQLNGLNSDSLTIGQQLLLQKSSNEEKSVPVANEGNTIEESVPIANESSTGSFQVYIVQKGDTLLGIASKYNTSVDIIKADNSLQDDLIHVGDKLRISGRSGDVTVSRSGQNIETARIVEEAAKYLGVPYLYGGSSPGGFDCSGFVQYIFKKFQITLPRCAADQYLCGVKTDRVNITAGDLVFFKCGGAKSINHVGIYCGDGMFIHSSSPSSGGVIYTSMGENYYSSSFVGARRIIR